MTNDISFARADRLLRESDVADQLAVEVSTLRRWRWAGTGPRFRKIGAAVRYHPADVAAYVDAASRGSTSDTGERNGDG